MATREAKQAKAARKASEAQTTLQIKVAIDPSEEIAPYYINYAEASMAAHECALSFVRVPTKLGSARLEEAKAGAIKLEPLVQIVFAPTLLPGLVRILTTLKEKYEKDNGPIREPGQSK